MSEKINVNLLMNFCNWVTYLTLGSVHNRIFLYLSLKQILYWLVRFQVHWYIEYLIRQVWVLLENTSLLQFIYRDQNRVDDTIVAKEVHVLPGRRDFFL